jgi:hypothetical protein
MFRLPKSYIDRFKSEEFIISGSKYIYVKFSDNTIRRCRRKYLDTDSYLDPDKWTVVYSLKEKEK